jgi:hypothetical protein
MTKLKAVVQNGGLFRFSTYGDGNILKEFMSFSKFAGFRGRFEFNYVDDHNQFETDATIKEFLFRDITNDLTNFDFSKSLEQRNTSHLNELLFKRYDLDDSIKQVDYATAKLFSILKAFLAPPHKVLFLNMEKVHFAPGLNERIARIFKREIELKNRTILIHGPMPKEWNHLCKGNIDQERKKNFVFTKTELDSTSADQEFQQFEENKHVA